MVCIYIECAMYGNSHGESVLTQRPTFEKKLLEVQSQLDQLVPDLDIKSVCGFIAGLAFAQDEDPLLGFDDWLCQEFRLTKSDLPWPILLCLAFEKNGIARENQAEAGFDAFFRFRSQARLDVPSK